MENNPVNYTDPSEHRKKSFNFKKAFASIGQKVTQAMSTVRMVSTVAATMARVAISATTTVAYVNTKINPHAYSDAYKQQVEAEYLKLRINQAMTRIREASNLFRNWGKALAKTL